MVYTPTSPHRIYRLLIALDGVNPTIWRLLDVPATYTLAKLHNVLQWAMGWEQQHPYYFLRGEFAYTDLPSTKKWDLGSLQEANTIVLDKIFGRRGRYLEYLYSLDADWRHHIWLEDVFLAKPLREYPYLLDGANACPPEVFSSPEAYQAFLDGQLEDVPRLPPDFDPAYFDFEPKPYPQAEVMVYDTADYGEDQKIPKFEPQALEMLGPLADQAFEIINSAPKKNRRELRRAIEDLMLADDCLPPSAKDVFDQAIDDGLKIDQFLVAVMLDHERLSEKYSLAPLHAAWITSFWPLSQPLSTYVRVLKNIDRDQESTISTMLNALARTPSGRTTLLDALDDLGDETTKLQAIDRLLKRDIRDERFLPILKSAMAKINGKKPTAAYLLAAYGGNEAQTILKDALDRSLAPIRADRRRFSHDELANRAEYAIFLADMLLQAGGAPEPEQQTLLNELESFFSDEPPSPGFHINR